MPGSKASSLKSSRNPGCFSGFISYSTRIQQRLEHQAISRYASFLNQCLASQPVSHSALQKSQQWAHGHCPLTRPPEHTWLNAEAAAAG